MSNETSDANDVSQMSNGQSSTHYGLTFYRPSGRHDGPFTIALTQTSTVEDGPDEPRRLPQGSGADKALAFGKAVGNQLGQLEKDQFTREEIRGSVDAVLSDTSQWGDIQDSRIAYHLVYSADRDLPDSFSIALKVPDMA